MRIGSVEFRPTVLPTLVTLLLLLLLLSLGFWQLDRAEQKRALLDHYQGATNDEPVQVDSNLQAAAELEYHPARVQGRFDPVHQFLLDNRIHQGMVGYEVITPLQLSGGEGVLLVNRGWVPLGNSRTVLPILPVTSDPVALTGLLKSPPQKVFTLGEGEDHALGWPKVLQRLRLELQAEQLGRGLLPMLLLLNADQEHGYVREWQPVVGFGPERNVGYAVQWFSLAAALLIIYLLVNGKRVDDDK